MRKIERSVTIQAPRAEVLAVIRDYDSYLYWMPDIVCSKVLTREGDITVAEFLYSGRRTYRCTLELIDNGLDRIQYEPTGGAEYGRDDAALPMGIQGEWELREWPSSEEVLLVGRIFGIRGCSFLSKIGGRRILRRFLTAMLYAIRDRVAFRRCPEGALLDWSDLEDEGVEKILRIIQDENGAMRMWFRGKTYELRPVD